MFSVPNRILAYILPTDCASVIAVPVRPNADTISFCTSSSAIFIASSATVLPAKSATISTLLID